MGIHVLALLFGIEVVISLVLSNSLPCTQRDLPTELPSLYSFGSAVASFILFIRRMASLVWRLKTLVLLYAGTTRTTSQRPCGKRASTCSSRTPFWLCTALAARSVQRSTGTTAVQPGVPWEVVSAVLFVLLLTVEIQNHPVTASRWCYDLIYFCSECCKWFRGLVFQEFVHTNTFFASQMTVASSGAFRIGLFFQSRGSSRPNVENQQAMVTPS